MMDVKKRLIDFLKGLVFEDIFVYDDCNQAEYTYEFFFKKCLSMANQIIKQVNGKTVVAVMENSVNLASLYFAVMMTDKTIAVIDPQKGANEIQEIVGQLDTSVVFTDDLVETFFPEMEKAVTVKQTVIEKLMERDFLSEYLITYTSGTSGITKGVRHSLNNLMMSAYSLHGIVEIKENSCLLHVMPMTYMAGILNSIFYPFVAGSKIVITERFSIKSARSFWSKVMKYKADLFWLSPSMLMMIDQMDRMGKGVAYCEKVQPTFLIGTSALTDKTRKQFSQKYKVPLYASYGLSETLFISIETKNTLAKNTVDSVGTFLEGVKYCMKENGEILLSVPWMYLGYTNENTASYFEGEYYKSGDLAKIDDGCLYIVERAKDLIIRGGMNISPALVEKSILTIGGLSECAVIGVKDGKGEERVCCVYTAERDAELDIELQIRTVVYRDLGKNYMIDYFWKVPQLTRNMNGKIDRKTMKEMWENENA